MGCENDKERRKEIYPDNSDLNKSSRLYVKSVTISWKKKRNFEIIYIVIRSNELNLLQFWYLKNHNSLMEVI